ncbi:Phosphatase YniC [Morganella morganii]|nr:Phosphatase YniC [Morganella morganii]
MSHTLPVQAAVFDMDGLLIDSEPFWLQSENQVFSSIGLDMSLRDKAARFAGSAYRPGRGAVVSGFAVADSL